MYALLLAGGALYLLKLPERRWPGRCDLALHSHLIWHLCYTAAFAIFTLEVARAAFAASAAAGLGGGAAAA